VTEAWPWLVVVGGINGAGKSTFAESLAQDPSLVGAVFLPMVDEVLVLSNSGYGAKPAVVAVAKAGEITLLDSNALPAVTAVLVSLIGP
jgi:hypothetical protein